MCLSLFAAFAFSAEQPVRLQDFAYAAQLQLEGHGAIYELALPEQVYAGVTRRDLGDLRVLNGANALVPHVLIVPKETGKKEIQSYDLPLFPFDAANVDAEGLKVRIDRGKNTKSIFIETSITADARKTLGYLVDAREVQKRIDRLTLAWPNEWPSGNVLLRIDVHASDDLEHWRSVASQVTIADLRHLGHRLQRNQVPISATRAKYFRIRFAEPGNAIELSGVRARGSTRIRKPDHVWREVEVRAAEQPGVYLFNNPGPMRVHFLQVSLPEINTLADAQLYSSPRVDGPWQSHRKTQLYRLRYGDNELESPHINLNGVSDPHWKLEVDQSGGGLGANPPDIRVGWQPHRLVFVARGAEPFTLAWGSIRVGPITLGEHNPLAKLQSTSIYPLPARLTGEVQRPGGEAPL